MLKQDCFAYLKEPNKCYALQCLQCKQGNCPFYKQRTDTFNIDTIERSVRVYAIKYNKRSIDNAEKT